MTVHDHVNLARRRLVDAGIPETEAALDARLLAQHVLGWDSARLVTAAGESGPADFADRYEALVLGRGERQPLAYLTGHREFWGLSFDVSPAVLVPRPETELIVETTLALVPDRFTAMRVADVGTGSGCVAVALAREYPAARFVATDTSSDALSVARQNALTHDVADRLEFVQTDLLNDVEGRFDLIVSNPPYVPERDRVTLSPEVRDHEPAAALFGGEDGMAVIERLIETAPRWMAPGGLLVFEFGFGQATAVEQLISNAGRLRMVGIRADLQGIARVAVVQTQARLSFTSP